MLKDMAILENVIYLKWNYLMNAYFNKSFKSIYCNSYTEKVLTHTRSYNYQCFGQNNYCDPKLYGLQCLVPIIPYLDDPYYIS